MEIGKEYIQLKQKYDSSINKKRKEIERQLTQLQDRYKTIDKDVEIFKNFTSKFNFCLYLKSSSKNSKVNYMPLVALRTHFATCGGAVSHAYD